MLDCHISAGEAQTPSSCASSSGARCPAGGSGRVTIGSACARTALLVPMLHRGPGVGVLAAIDRGASNVPLFTDADEKPLKTRHDGRERRDDRANEPPPAAPAAAATVQQRHAHGRREGSSRPSQECRTWLQRRRSTQTRTRNEVAIREAIDGSGGGSKVLRSLQAPVPRRSTALLGERVVEPRDDELQRLASTSCLDR